MSTGSCFKMEENQWPALLDFRLHWYLKELDKEEFHKFKETLKKKYLALTIHNIPETEVDHADVQQLASLMQEYYAGPFAWAVSICVFEDMKMHVLSNKAKEEMRRCSMPSMPESVGLTRRDQGTKEPLSGDPWNYKAHVMTKFATRLDVQPSFKSHEMQALVDVFNPDERGFQPHTVVLHGKSGIGKSALARKIMLCWAQDELYHNRFTYVFFFCIREMKGMEKSSLAGMIAKEWSNSLARTAEIMSQPERLLFIIDGFDDVESVLGEEDLRLCGDWAEEHPVSILLYSLLKKVLLPQSFLLITATDTGVERLKSMVVSPRYLLVGGSTVWERMKQLPEHIHCNHQKMQILDSLMANHQLLDLCQASTVCSLVCEALQLQKGLGTSDVPGCTTLTGLYTTFVFQQLTPQDPFQTCLNQEERVSLMGLCRMAAEGVWNMRSVFYDGDLRAHGLRESELSSLFPMNFLLKDDHGQQCYTFIHLSLRDFCAALYYVLEGMEKWDGYFRFIKNIRSITELKQAGFNAHLIPMKRFLFGLMSKDVKGALEVLLGCPVTLTVRQKLLDWVSLLGDQANTTNPEEVLETFYYLFETQDEKFVHLALNSFQEVRLPVNQRMDLIVSAFCLRQCQNLRKIQVNVKDIFSVEELADLRPSDPQWRRQHKALMNEWWEHFCSALSTLPKIEQLHLGSSALSEWAMKTLCAKLRQPDCKIRSLIFRDAEVATGLQHLWTTFIGNRNLKSLHLGSTCLRVEDVKSACQVLRHPNCSLESLRLDFCELTHTSYLVISKTLRSSNRLKSLSLAGNKITQDGMRYLCDSLKSLEKLILDNCDLGPVSCQELASTLTNNLSLTHLCLSNNNLETEGLRLLCESLKSRGCGLQRLVLNQCNIQGEACGFLSLVFMNNSQLTHLSLSMNPLEDQGMMFLCEALRTPCCHLQELELVNCGLTDVCCEDIASVISINKSLKSLDLTANALGDSGVMALCEGLRKEDSTLMRLGLEECGLTSNCCEVLSLALSCNPHLSSLNLMKNDLGTRGVMKLCSAFMHLTCNLQIVGLWMQQYPAEVRQRMEEVQRLKPHMVISCDWDSIQEDEDRYWWKN